jgi:hypothetical protein
VVLTRLGAPAAARYGWGDVSAHRMIAEGIERAKVK